MQCPQCGAETPDDKWNCVSCRVNLYWAHEHYEELARIREQQGLQAAPAVPAFLTQSHRKELNERAARGLDKMNKVREIARRAMQCPPQKTSEAQ